uniref:Trans-Golgi network integral membrane protein TGN38 n=1 Tax=Cacopsylla melanoneura TaxID=428564 RepID=A0A8D9FHA3_9HEMI
MNMLYFVVLSILYILVQAQNEAARDETLQYSNIFRLKNHTNYLDNVFKKESKINFNDYVSQEPLLKDVVHIGDVFKDSDILFLCDKNIPNLNNPSELNLVKKYPKILLCMGLSHVLLLNGMVLKQQQHVDQKILALPKNKSELDALISKMNANDTLKQKDMCGLQKVTLPTYSTDVVEYVKILNPLLNKEEACKTLCLGLDGAINPICAFIMVSNAIFYDLIKQARPNNMTIPLENVDSVKAMEQNSGVDKTLPNTKEVIDSQKEETVPVNKGNVALLLNKTVSPATDSGNSGNSVPADNGNSEASAATNAGNTEGNVAIKNGKSEDNVATKNGNSESNAAISNDKSESGNAATNTGKSKGSIDHVELTSTNKQNNTTSTTTKTVPENPDVVDNVNSGENTDDNTDYPNLTEQQLASNKPEPPLSNKPDTTVNEMKTNPSDNNDNIPPEPTIQPLSDFEGNNAGESINNNDAADETTNVKSPKTEEKKTEKTQTDQENKSSPQKEIPTPSKTPDTNVIDENEIQDFGDDQEVVGAPPVLGDTLEGGDIVNNNYPNNDDNNKFSSSVDSKNYNYKQQASDLGGVPDMPEKTYVIPKDEFVEAEDSHFFSYFLLMFVVCIVMYLVLCNKRKLLALALEGRHGAGGRRNRTRRGTYSRVKTGFDESKEHLLY